MSCKTYALLLTVLLVVGLFTPALAGEIGERIDELIGELEEPEWRVRRDAALELAELKPDNEEAIRALTETLRDPDPNVPWAAEEALAAIGEPAVDEVANLLSDDPDPEVRIRAASVLGEIGSPSEILAPPLAERLRVDDDLDVRYAAIHALQSVGITEDDGVLSALSLATGDEFRVALVAHQLLRGVVAEEEMEAYLRRELKNEESSVRRRASLALAELGDISGETVSVLKELLSDEKPDVRASSARALAAGGKVSEGALPELLELLDDREPEVRRATVRALHSIGPDRMEVISEIALAIGDPDSGVAGPARRAAFDLEDPEFVVSVLLEGLIDDELRDDAERGLKRIARDVEEVVEKVTALLEHEERKLRLSAARVLEAAGEKAEKAVDGIGKALQDSYGQVRITAARTLLDLGLSAGPAVEHLESALEDDEVEVRRAAARALNSIGKQAKPAVSGLARALDDGDLEVRRMAASTLAALGKDAEDAVERLGSALQDEDLWVRRSAAEALVGLEDGAEPVTEYLILALGDEDRTVSWRAAESLKALGYSRSDAVSKLSDQCVDHDPAVRVSAYRALGRLGPGREFASIIKQGLVDRDQKVRREAARLAGTMVIYPAQARELIDHLTVLVSEPDEWEQIVAEAAGALDVIASDDGDVIEILNENQDRIRKAEDRLRMEAVREFADNALHYGRDRWGQYESPLFADGIHIDTFEPALWVYEGNEWVISNFASQQNLMRTLVGLTNLTGDQKYRDVAETVTGYMFDNHSADCGLLYWGGHQFIDLRTGRNHGEFDADCHEFKNNFPYYQLMWDVDPEATRQFLEAFWNAHVVSWGVLDMNRHGSYGKEMGNLWNNEFMDPEPFFEGDGLTFINCGSDLIYAGAAHYHFTGDEGALEWTKRLAEQYVEARHPETGLGVYQYSQPRKRSEPPEDPNHPRFTWSTFGDRAQRQFGPEFGEIALEGNFLAMGRPVSIYYNNAVIQLQLAERLDGEVGERFLEWTVDGLRAYAEHAYDAETNTFRPLWADGTDLTGYEIKRPGYYGSEGTVIRGRSGSSDYLYSYALGYLLSGDPVLWETVQGISRGLDLGELGSKLGQEVDVNLETKNDDPLALLAMIELYRREEHRSYLELARTIGNNIVDHKFHNGFFLPSEDHLYARFNALEPLALLALEAAIRGEPDRVPRYNSGRGYIHGNYDGEGRTYDSRVIWSQSYRLFMRDPFARWQ